MTQAPRAWLTRLGLRSALAAAALAAASQASGLSCVPRAYDQAEAMLMFGPAKMVFVGTLVEIAKDKREESWHSSAEGTFAVEQTFKGAPDRRQRVRVNSDTATGFRYLVYANEEKGELRADAACWPQAILFPHRVTQHLAYLETMPPPGSGGQVSVGLMRLPFQGRVTNFPLELEGGGPKVGLVTDAKGSARQTGVPAGVYRLATTPPPGYRFECYAKSCDALAVHDRGLSLLDIRLVPLAVLKIELRDAAGKPVALRAEFNVYDAASGRLIGPLSHYWSPATPMWPWRRSFRATTCSAWSSPSRDSTASPTRWCGSRWFSTAAHRRRARRAFR